MQNFSDLTIDILQAICSELESTADLLSVALTSRQLCHVVIPDHLDFRIIRCGRNQDDVWKFLQKHSKQSSRVRELEIIDRGYRSGTTGLRPEIRVPRQLQRWKTEQAWSQDDLTPNQRISKAIALMSSLQSFRWLDGRERPSELLFRALQTSPNLRRLEILDHEPVNFTPYEDYDDAVRMSSQAPSKSKKKKKSKKSPASTLWQIRRLQTFSYTRSPGNYVQDEGRAAIDGLVSFLPEQGRHLVDLHLFHPGGKTSNGVSFTKLFAHARWPNLKRLTVGGHMFNEGNIEFFSHHTKLEVLRIFEFQLGDYNLLPLQNLRSLDVDTVLKPSDLPVDILRRVDHLGISVTLLEAEDTLKLFQNAKQIRSLILRQSFYTPYKWKLLFSQLTRLEKLAIIWEDWDDFVGTASPEELCACFATLPKSLTHLRAMCTSIWSGQYDSDNPEDSTEATTELGRFNPALRALSSILPNLCLVAFRPEYPIEDELDWLVIDRASEGQYRNCHFATHRHARGMDYEKWGDCYVGAQEVVYLDEERVQGGYGMSYEEDLDPENWREWAEYTYHSD